MPLKGPCTGELWCQRPDTTQKAWWREPSISASANKENLFFLEFFASYGNPSNHGASFNCLDSLLSHQASFNGLESAKDGVVSTCPSAAMDSGPGRLR